MKRFLLAAALLPALLLVSCENDQNTIYGFYTVGNFGKGSLFSTDEGYAFHLVNNATGAFTDTMGRCSIVCDVLNKTKGGNGNEYDISLIRFDRLLTKEALIGSQTADDPEFGADPILFETGWFSAGYANLSFSFEYQEGSKTRHLVNLEWDDTNPSQDTLFFRLRHNAYGESGPALGDRDAVRVNSGFFSIPVSKHVAAGRKEAVIGVISNWYPDGSEGLDTVRDTTYGQYIRRDFEHPETK